MKYPPTITGLALALVTPLAGVWIEILKGKTIEDVAGTSLPLRECGLKSQRRKADNMAKASLPLRECGLKYVHTALKKQYKLSLPLRECGLKFTQSAENTTQDSSLPLRECGLKLHNRIFEDLKARHSPCGSVD